jgi:hypothetical protein
MLGKLLAVANASGQLQLLELLLGAVSIPRSWPAARKDPAVAKQRAANCVAVAVAGLAGVAPIAKRAKSGPEGLDKVMMVVSRFLL